MAQLCIYCELHEPDDDGFCSDSCRQSDELLSAARAYLTAPSLQLLLVLASTIPQAENK
jgi:predicted nucleic acid-binding Zn ribbon protein